MKSSINPREFLLRSTLDWEEIPLSVLNDPALLFKHKDARELLNEIIFKLRVDYCELFDYEGENTTIRERLEFIGNFGHCISFLTAKYGKLRDSTLNWLMSIEIITNFGESFEKPKKLDFKRLCKRLKDGWIAEDVKCGLYDQQYGTHTMNNLTAFSAILN